MAPEQNIAERGMAVGLRALNRVAASDTLERLGLRDPTIRLLHQASKTTGRAGRPFSAAQRLSRPARQPRTGSGDLFDLEPTEEQALLRDSVREFALAELRGRASAADAACATPGELLAQSNDLGLTMVGVPEELGGATPPVRERAVCRWFSASMG